MLNFWISSIFHPGSCFTAPSTEIQPEAHRTGRKKEQTFGQLRLGNRHRRCKNLFRKDQEHLSKSIKEHSRMDFKPPKRNESRVTATNCRKTRYAHSWTTVDHKKDQFSLEPFKQQSESLWTKRKVSADSRHFSTFLDGQPQ